MDFQQVRVMVQAAISAVDRKLTRIVLEGTEDDWWCRLDSITFDPSLCSESDDEDATEVIVNFSWCDVMVYKDNPSGMEGSIHLFEEDLISSDFLAGMIYSKILTAEKLF